MLTNPDLKYFAKQSQIAIGNWLMVKHTAHDLPFTITHTGF